MVFKGEGLNMEVHSGVDEILICFFFEELKSDINLLSLLDVTSSILLLQKCIKKCINSTAITLSQGPIVNTYTYLSKIPSPRLECVGSYCYWSRHLVGI